MFTVVKRSGSARHLRFVASVIDMLAARSRSTTPASLISGKSSTNDQGVQVSGINKRDDKKVVQPIQPPGQRNQQYRDRRDPRGDGQVT